MSVLFCVATKCLCVAPAFRWASVVRVSRWAYYYTHSIIILLCTYLVCGRHNKHSISIRNAIFIRLIRVRNAIRSIYTPDVTNQRREVKITQDQRRCQSTPS